MISDEIDCSKLKSLNLSLSNSIASKPEEGKEVVILESTKGVSRKVILLGIVEEETKLSSQYSGRPRP